MRETLEDPLYGNVESHIAIKMVSHEKDKEAMMLKDKVHKYGEVV
ncbi:unnamed protein product [marine sediment metagenome]|uniref:Uncharacterized protein n=1 Tax=marine sediment metagenome TaxID=412755 RepID=X1QFV7_9ZZZZ